MSQMSSCFSIDMKAVFTEFAVACRTVMAPPFPPPSELLYWYRAPRSFWPQAVKALNGSFPELGAETLESSDFPTSTTSPA